MNDSEKLLCIDPGTKHSGVVLLEGDDVVWSEAAMKNQEVLAEIARGEFDRMAIECFTYLAGMAGKEVIRSIEFVGIMTYQCHLTGRPYHKLGRSKVFKIIAGKKKKKPSKDAQIRSAIVKLYPRTGKGKEPAVGTQNHPGPLYGVSSHAWAALAVGLAYRIESGICGLPGLSEGLLAFGKGADASKSLQS